MNRYPKRVAKEATEPVAIEPRSRAAKRQRKEETELNELEMLKFQLAAQKRKNTISEQENQKLKKELKDAQDEVETKEQSYNLLSNEHAQWKRKQEAKLEIEKSVRKFDVMKLTKERNEETEKAESADKKLENAKANAETYKRQLFNMQLQIRKQKINENEKLDELNMCPICLRDYTKKSERIPRILTACGHTICLECARNIGEEHSIKCPNCRVITDMGTKSIDELPRNFTLINILDSLTDT